LDQAFDHRDSHAFVKAASGLWFDIALCDEALSQILLVAPFNISDLIPIRTSGVLARQVCANALIGCAPRSMPL
jgi:hypothetical protein